MAESKALNTLEFEKPIIEMECKLTELERFASEKDLDLTHEIDRLKTALQNKTREIFERLTPWERVQIARHPQRPETNDYVEMMVERFMELHGDRAFRDDLSILTGFGTIGGEKVILIGQRKGKNLAERTLYNFGCAHPEGYRKALHKMELAARFNIPVVTFINTPGAYPGIEAEERGQFYAIAKNLLEMARLKTIIISIVIGEGGSGGALGIGVADRIAMLENAYYSVISPEGCAAILWKDPKKKGDAAKALRLTAPDLQELGIVDDIIPEPLGGAHKDRIKTANNLRDYIKNTIATLRKVPMKDLVEQRYAKYRKIGFFTE
ncbi:MAG: acetyl-CoA carboxylase carboxyltransferase subunit alpha [Planctomycetota bacterium]